MTSINTNTSAMTALQTMRSINKSLDTTQNRISTGYAVNTASDNAAYWSIATTMRSDNMAMSAVQDALGLGAAQTDTAYTAMEVVKDTLDKIKAKVVASQQPNIDKGKIQEDIRQLQNDLTTYAKSASFSGGNWLNVNKTGVEKVVASFVRDSDGNISLGTIDVDTTKTALFNADGEVPGLLEKGNPLNIELSADAAVTAGDGTAAAAINIFTHDYAEPLKFEDGNVVKFDLVINGESKTITLDHEALGDEVASADEMAAIVDKALVSAGITNVKATAADPGGADGTQAAGSVTLTHTGTTADDTLEAKNTATSSNGNFFDVTEMDISSADEAELTDYMHGVDRMLERIIEATSDLGAIKSRISSQQDFIGKIMNAVERGVGQLVDADLDEESTRLKALQMQQQLGVQSLTIANNSSQVILSLFR